MKTTVRLRRPAPPGRSRAGTAVSGGAAAVALGILVLATVFIAVALPRANLGYRTRMLQQTFRAASPTARAVLADADLTGLTRSGYRTRPGLLGVSQVRRAGHGMAGSLQQAHLPLAPPAAQWAGITATAGELSGAPKPAPGSMSPPQLELVYRTALDRYSRLVAGSLPTRVAGNAAFQVAVTAATAARLGLHVGSRLRAAGQALLVTGIIRPVSPGSSFWTVDPNTPAPQLTYPTPDSPPFLSTAAFVGAAELQALETRVGSQHLTGLWVFPLDLGQVSADQATGLWTALQRVTALPTAVGGAGASTPRGGAGLEVDFSSGLVTVLPPVLASDAAVQGALSPLFISLAAVAAVVLVMGAMLVAGYRRAEFAVMRARGASLAQVAALAARGAAAAVLPAAAIAVAAGVLLTPGPPSALAVWLAAAITATALAGPPLLAVAQLRTRRTTALRPAAGRRIRLARRWVTNAALAAVAVAGLIVLRAQGLPAPGRLDVLTSLAPVLAAVPIALLVAGCYPLALACLARLARRSRGVVMVVGLARGRAAAQAVALPAFGLIVAFSVAAFAAMERGTVTGAEVAASWQATAADAVVTVPGAGPGLTRYAQRVIARVPGAQQVAVLSVLGGSAGNGRSLRVVVVDPRQYAELVAATPAPRFPAGLLARPPGAGATGQVPALISPAARAMLGRSGTLRVAGLRLRLHVAGRLTRIAGVPPASRFAVLPSWALGRRAPPPTVMAVQGPRLDTGALARAVRHAVPGARITLRSQLLDAIGAAPLPHGGLITLAQGAAAAAAFSLLILLLMLVLSARSRELTLARLDVMGLGPAQSRRITVVESLPVIICAALGGTACALALVPLAAPAVDLAAFTGSRVRVPLHADLLALGAVTGGLLLLAGAALMIQDRLTRRLDVSQALRAGE
jgi:putative ABC transport system permease protein